MIVLLAEILLNHILSTDKTVIKKIDDFACEQNMVGMKYGDILDVLMLTYISNKPKLKKQAIAITDNSQVIKCPVSSCAVCTYKEE